MDFEALGRVGFDRLLSDLGRRMFTPQGIFYWTARAKSEGKPGLNGTIGSAFLKKSALYRGAGDDFVIGHLPGNAAFFPEFDPADVFAYAPICGVPRFREAWRKWIVWKGGEEYADVAGHLTLPIVTPGISGGIWLAARFFLNPGEKIVSPMQRWENYDQIITMNAGIEFIEFPHFAGDEFNVDGFVETVDKVLQTSSRAVAILNFPNNPTGYNPTVELVRERLLPEVKELVETHDKPLVILFDDAYEGYTYDDDSLRVSPFYEFVNIDDRILPVKLDGISKEMLWYGGRIGCITFGISDEWLNETSIDALSKDLDNKIGGMIRGTVSNNPHVVQTAIAKMLEDPQRVVEQRRPTVEALRGRWQALAKGMKNLPAGVRVDPFQGGFFLFLNLDGIDARAVAESMLTKHGVTVVPTQKPDKNWNGLRLAYCGINEDKIPEVFAALRAAVAEVVSSGASA